MLANLTDEQRRQMPLLTKYTGMIQTPNRAILGRESEMQKVMASLQRPELCNVMLIAEAGSGKTALVQGCMMMDEERMYLEVNLADMIADVQDSNQMAALLRGLFDEAVRYKDNVGRELVLFIDEFHQIMSLSTAAAEALKPILADSGVRGIKVIAATTTDEFTMWIRPNLPLQERLERINLAPLGKSVVISILKDMATRYNVNQNFYDDHLYERIYEYTNRYIPASVQPRKSIKVFDAMIGWHRAFGRMFDEQLLADVIYDAENIRVNFMVDATKIKESLDSVIFAQEYATTVLANRLHACVAGLNNTERPMSSFIFSGSTGTGKTQTAKELAKLLFGEDDSNRLISFDMTEFANPDSLERFRTELTDRVWARPYSIVLLDEVEKACAEVTRVLLQVLADGRLVDANNREVTFRNAYIILTTNAGSEIYKQIARFESDDTGSGKEMLKYDDLIRKSLSETTGDNRFPPELLGRVDVIVPFQPLSEATQERIVKRKLSWLTQRVLQLHGVRVSFFENVVPFIIQERLSTESDSGGARKVLSIVEDHVVSKLAKYINEHPEDKNLGVWVDGETRYENKHVLKGTAEVRVARITNQTSNKRK